MSTVNPKFSNIDEDDASFSSYFSAGRKYLLHTDGSMDFIGEALLAPIEIGESPPLKHHGKSYSFRDLLAGQQKRSKSFFGKLKAIFNK